MSMNGRIPLEIHFKNVGSQSGTTCIVNNPADWFMTSCFHNSWLCKRKSHHSCINCWASWWQWWIFPQWWQSGRVEILGEAFLTMSFPYFTFMHIQGGLSNQSTKHKAKAYREKRRRQKGIKKNDNMRANQRDWGGKTIEKRAEYKLNRKMTVYVHVCDVYCSVSQLWVMGPLAGHSFDSSWDGVFRSSARFSATLLCWPKHCFIITTAGGGNRLFRVYEGKEISRDYAILMAVLTHAGDVRQVTK